MISPVDAYIEDFANAGADFITAHVEATPHIHRTLQAIRATGAKAGVALNPGTPAEAVAEPSAQAACQSNSTSSKCFATIRLLMDSMRNSLG